MLGNLQFVTTSGAEMAHFTFWDVGISLFREVGLAIVCCSSEQVKACEDE